MDENDDLLDLPALLEVEGAALTMPTDDRSAALITPALAKLRPSRKKDLLIELSRVSLDMYLLRQRCDALAIAARDAGSSAGLLAQASGLSERQVRRRWFDDA